MGIKLDRWTKDEELKLLFLKDSKHLADHQIATILTKEFNHYRNPRTSMAVKVRYQKLRRSHV